MKTRFSDEIIRDRTVPQAFRDAVKNAVIIEASNVGEYYWAGNDKEVWHIEKDFPNLAPPFPEFFIEFQAPSMIRSEVRGVLPWHNKMSSAWGVMCWGQDLSKLEPMTFRTEEERAKLTRQVIASRKKQEELMQTFLPELEGKYGVHTRIEDIAQELEPMKVGILNEYVSLSRLYKLIQEGNWAEVEKRVDISREAYRWTLDMALILKMQGQAWGPIWNWHICLNEDGSVAIDPVTKLPMVTSRPLDVLEEIAESKLHAQEPGAIDYLQTLQENVKPYNDCALLAISFLHCRNIVLDKVSPPVHRVHNKAAKKRGERDYQPVSYHTLDIRPMRAVLEREGGASPTGQGSARALHICRGHFRHYKEGRGLFGRPGGGTYWVPQHARGGATEEISLKDYNIKL